MNASLRIGMTMVKEGNLGVTKTMANLRDILVILATEELHRLMATAMVMGMVNH